MSTWVRVYERVVSRAQQDKVLKFVPFFGRLCGVVTSGVGSLAFDVTDLANGYAVLDNRSATALESATVAREREEALDRGTAGLSWTACIRHPHSPLLLLTHSPNRLATRSSLCGQL
jgi:hypothetical protein